MFEGLDLLAGGRWRNLQTARECSVFDAPAPPWERERPLPAGLRTDILRAEALALSRVSADARGRLAAAAEWFARFPPIRRVPIEQTRRWIRDGGGPYPARYLSPAARMLPRGNVVPATCRILTGSYPVLYVHVHGGGFIFGSSDGQDRALEWVNLAIGAHVVSIEYSLAPEHPYPAGLDDVTGALDWIASHPSELPPFKKWVLAGESAGANLCVAALCRMRDRRLDNQPSGVVLSYGFFDLGLTPSAREWGDSNLVIDTATLRWYAESYAPQGLWSTPEISPIRADLGSLPPALFVVGTADPLLDDSILLADAWRAAGGRAALDVWPGGMHKFDYGTGEPATSARRRIQAFVREVVGP
jgi:acetyl esterase/lipase